MCGLVGFLSQSPFLSDSCRQEALHAMMRSVIHRGPDSSASWSDLDSGIHLGHQRLSIQDLSPAGVQPMHSNCGRYVLAFNGEIYNHLELRKSLANVRWRGHSDTETLVESISCWGINKTISSCIGMFAICIWDKKDRTLTLARDRIGEKPLYYGWQGNGEYASFLFGSDLSALRIHPSFSAEIDRDALALYFRHNCIPAPYSIYQNIFKLQPGCLLSVSWVNRQPKISSYWSLPNVAQQGVSQPFTFTDTQAVDALEELLMDAVRLQMAADVPLGAFLSGGVDSSLVVALMQAQSSRPVKTFTIGFNEDSHNEALYAKAVSQHLATDHTELYLTPEQALEVIPRLPTLYSEPFADSSQIPTFLVSQLARQHVTVSLSGDGGDELFAGYQRYMFTKNFWSLIGSFPLPSRRLVARFITRFSVTRWNELLHYLRPLMPSPLRRANLGDKLHKSASLLSSPSIESLYLGLISGWQPDGIVLGASEPLTHLRGDPLPFTGLDIVHRLMALDSVTYLPDDILVKVDRAAMGVSLETRVPFLDSRVVEFAWKLPQHLKTRDGSSKWLLRQVLSRHVPQNLIDRPKMGFGIPIDSWLRGPLREWSDELLSESLLYQQGFLNPVPIRQKWLEHLSGQRNWQHQLWPVLMFQSWLDQRVPSTYR